MLFMLQHVDIFMNITCVYSGIWHMVYIILIYCFLCVLRDFTLCFTFFFVSFPSEITTLTFPSENLRPKLEPQVDVSCSAKCMIFRIP